MGPLSGLKVVELGTYVAVPKAARMMADWGATVIKVENTKGEDWRREGQNYGLPSTEDNNPAFQVENANKMSISINLKTPEGKQVFLKLLEEADVFLTNTRYKGLTKLGLDYPSLKERFPKLIYAHLSGLGETGPDKDRPGYDLTAFWARSSILSFWSYKEFPPMYPGPGVGDTSTGQALCAGVLAALYQRASTGRGDCIEISLFGTALWSNSMGVIMGQEQYGLSYPLSLYDGNDPSYLLYETNDHKWVLLALAWEDDYPELFAHIGMENFIGDPRFSTASAAKMHLKEDVNIIREAIGKMSSRQLKEELDKCTFAYEMLATFDEVSKDEQAWANGYLKRVALENGSEVVLPTTPIQFGSMEKTRYDLAPQLGANTNEILTKLGYTDQEIAKLCENGAVLQHP